MDFNTVPLRDEREKRVWELLVCDPQGSFRQSCYANNQQVNSSWVAEQLREYLQKAPVSPSAIRVFRSRMSSILQRACESVGVPMRLSRRVYALWTWMQERSQSVYPYETQYIYSPDESTPVQDLGEPAPLPDQLQGERWALVTLRVAELQAADDWSIAFGERFPVLWQQWDPETQVSGLVIISQRALPLAAWMSGLEPSFLTLTPNLSTLLLEAGQTDRYVIATLPKSLYKEAEAFISRKQTLDGIHFLAIQSQLSAESFAGFWLLKDIWV
jgi:hypothetical protein